VQSGVARNLAAAKIGTHDLVLQGEVDVEVAGYEGGELVAEAFGVPAGHEGVAVEGAFLVDEAGEGGDFALTGDEAGVDLLAEADGLGGNPEGFGEAFDLGGVFRGDEDGGEVGFGNSEAGFDGGEEFGAVEFDFLGGHIADAGEFGEGGGGALGDVEEDLIAEEGARGDVVFVGVLLAKGGDFAEDGEVLAFENGSAADAGVKLAGIDGLAATAAHFVAGGTHPGHVAEGFELLAHGMVDGGEVTDVVDGIGELGAGEGAAVPGGVGVGFFEGDAGEVFDGAPEGGGVGDAEHAGGDLGVEHVLGGEAGFEPGDFDILVASVADLFEGRVGEKLPEREEGLAVEGEGVDHFDALGGGDLNEAEDGEVGGFADEFGVEGEGAGGAEVVAEFRKLGGGGQEIRGGGGEVGHGGIVRGME
jgi:hypothetical protein